MNILSMSVTDIIVRVCAVFICLTFHELAHAYAAYLLGDTTAQSQGRLSINPMAHVDPIGLVCLFLAGIGWAKPVPVNPAMFRIRNKQLGMAITAAAGPAMNFFMSYVCIFLYCTLIFFPIGIMSGALTDFLWEIALLGIGLGIFNLIPIPPLDGSKILMLFLPYSAMKWMYRNEQFIRFFFLIAVFFGAFNDIIMQGLSFVLDGMIDSVILIFSALGLI